MKGKVRRVRSGSGTLGKVPGFSGLSRIDPKYSECAVRSVRGDGRRGRTSARALDGEPAAQGGQVARRRRRSGGAPELEGPGGNGATQEEQDHGQSNRGDRA